MLPTVFAFMLRTVGPPQVLYALMSQKHFY
jgi:hypothetical protein